jgi:hypothetical protein
MSLGFNRVTSSASEHSALVGSRREQIDNHERCLRSDQSLTIMYGPLRDCKD